MANATDPQSNFKYEIAFSFLACDEGTAIALNDLVSDRLSTFLYSKRQEELAGQDGEQRFNAVFGSEARVVVVLYRAGWGQTPWTRIEETAIHNRGFEDGYEFLVLIPLDKPPTAPKWLPRTYIWVGLDRWGLHGAAAVIEAQVANAGGQIRQETAEDQAQRVRRKQLLERERTRSLNSDEGVRTADNQVRDLLQEMEGMAQRISTSGLGVTSRQWGPGEAELVQFGAHCIVLNWRHPYSNSLDNGVMTVDVYRGFPRRPGRMIFDEGPRLERRRITFNLDEIANALLA